MIQRLQEKRNEEGFTLIELLIVIIVLGILAAIVVFAVGTTRKDSVSASCKTNFKAVELSAEAVNTKMGGYPSAANVVAPNVYGALLKTYPTSNDYSLLYAPSGAVNKTVGSDTFLATYSLKVQKNGADVATNPTTSAGCDAL